MSNNHQLRAKWAVTTGRAGGSLIKGKMAAEPEEGLFPGYSASGQDVWVEEAHYDRSGIVLSAVGARCGKCFKADGKWAAIANTHVLLPRKGFDRDFLWWRFNDERFWDKGGAAQPYVRIGQSLDQLIFAPTFPEQQRIAGYLDGATGKIDRLMSLRRRQMELLREQRAALIQQAVTRGLNPRAPLKDSGLPWLGQIPKHWELKRLKHIARFVQTGATPPSTNLNFYDDDGMNWFGPGDFGDELVLGKSARRISDTAVSAGHAAVYEPPVILVVGIGASVGKVGLAIERCFTNQQVNAIALRKPHSAYFFGYFLAVHSQIIAASSNQATLPIFNQTQTRSFPVPVPPPDEQMEILAHIQRETAKLDGLHRSYERQLALLAEYRASLIHECVTGQRAVPEN